VWTGLLWLRIRIRGGVLWAAQNWLSASNRRIIPLCRSFCTVQFISVQWSVTSPATFCVTRRVAIWILSVNLPRSILRTCSFLLSAFESWRTCGVMHVIHFTRHRPFLVCFPSSFTAGVSWLVDASLSAGGCNTVEGTRAKRLVHHTWIVGTPCAWRSRAIRSAILNIKIVFHLREIATNAFW
jgi:hypothetical protein